MAAFPCNGWPPSRGISGRLAVEWVARFPWNRRPSCRGIRTLSQRRRYQKGLQRGGGRLWEIEDDEEFRFDARVTGGSLALTSLGLWFSLAPVMVKNLESLRVPNTIIALSLMLAVLVQILVYLLSVECQAKGCPALDRHRADRYRVVSNVLGAFSFYAVCGLLVMSYLLAK